MRDVYEVANQLGGYVGPNTDERLAIFLLRESDEAAKLADKIEGLQADLDSAIEFAYNRGAHDWVRMNYPSHYARLSKGGK